jgi:hypothetical protein
MSAGKKKPSRHTKSEHKPPKPFSKAHTKTNTTYKIKNPTTT